MFDKLIDELLHLKEQLLPFQIVMEYEMGVRLRFGKNPKPLKPGLHLKIPFIDAILTATVTEETGCCRYMHLTTKDEKTITVAPVIKYIVEDVVKWLIYTNEPTTNLYDLTRLIASDYFTDLNWEECKQKPHWTKIKNKINSKVESMGAKITEFGLADICLSRIIVTNL